MRACVAIALLALSGVNSHPDALQRTGAGPLAQQQSLRARAVSVANDTDSFNPRRLHPSELFHGRLRLHPKRDAKKGPATGKNAIKYRGGALMLGDVHTYLVWYGDWGQDTAVSIVEDFVANVGATPWYKIQTTYRQGTNRVTSPAVSTSISLTKSYTTSAYLGNDLSDNDIASIISDAVQGGHLPSDTQGIYIVLTSEEVDATSGFCSDYCGWHSFMTVGGTDLKFGFVGNSARCPRSCSAVTAATSPNNNLGADGIVSILAHELVETVTDPFMDGYFDGFGYENADKCAWTFGRIYQATPGKYANMKAGSRHYLVQQNWVATTQRCAMAFP